MINSFVKRIKKLPKLRADNLLLYVTQKALARKLESRGVIDATGRLTKPRIPKPRFVKPETTFDKLVSVGGLGWSGSSAVIDLLAEYESATISFAGIAEDPKMQIEPTVPEFDLARAAGGLFGLERAFQTHSFFVRDAALRLFCEVAERTYLGCRSFFGEEFVELTTIFLNKLIASRAENRGGGYDYCSHLSVFGSQAVTHFLGKPRDPSMSYIFYLKDLSVQQYRVLAHEYLTGILGYIKSGDLLVLDQATSDHDFDNDRYQDYFGPIKSIFVWRDPSDVFAASVTYASPQAFFPRDPDEYIAFYKNNIGRALSVRHDKFMTVRFEDLLFNYDDEVARIEKFVEIDSVMHTKPMTRFIPKESIARSVGLWKMYHDQKSMARIREGLRDFIYGGASV